MNNKTIQRQISAARIIVLSFIVFYSSILCGAAFDPAASDYSGNKGVTVYVSKLGDNTDGSSWAKGYHTIQSALLAVPDAKGGHRIIVRPDKYVEGDLYPSHKGADGSYNLLIGDYDGRLGSGATGWVIIDSSDPDKGLKSVDWWSPIIGKPDFSGIIWDRWILRNLYATGGDAGLFWDVIGAKGAEFTVIVEDCVSIGRAFGAGVGTHVGRAGEPIVFRRTYCMCLDWWGDAAGVYVRAENPEKRDVYDAVFEDCTIISPDNAFQAGNPGFDGYTRVKFKDCRMIVLNFSQPHGTPSTGIIYSTIKGDYLHVDLEDSTLMGYKVFGSGGAQYGSSAQEDGGAISYTTKGKVRAYVQYTRTVPKGMELLGTWPVEVFNSIGQLRINEK